MHIRTVSVPLFFLTLAAALLLPPSGGRAQESAQPRALTVMEAVGLALADNHAIHAQQSALLAQEADVGVARSHLLPKLTFEERYSRTTNPGYAFFSRLNQERITMQDFNPDLLGDPDPIGDFQSSLTLEQPLLVRQAWLGLGMARREHRAKAEELHRKKEETAYQVLRAACMISSAREYERAAKLGVDEAQEHLRVAKLRYENGLGQYADTLRAATAESQARQRRNVAGKNLRLARRYLGLLLARDEEVDISGGGLELPLHAAAYYQTTARSRSDLKAAGLRDEIAQQNIRLAEAGYWPYMGMGGTYQYNDHDKPLGSEGENWQVGAFLRWNLFDGTKREYERAKARGLAEQSRASVAAMQDGISYRIAEAYANVEEARANSALAQQSLATAEEGARLVRLRYTNGLASLADLLNTQTALEEARAGVVQQQNAARTAQAALSYESGTILADLNLPN